MNALFVNSGLLGQRIFARYVQRAFVDRPDDIRAAQIVLTRDLTLADRALRRVMCQRFWPSRPRMHNFDLYRYRAEWHTGVAARRRIRRLEESGTHFDVLHFHRQATAYASVERMRRTPSIVSIDCTQRCVVADADPLEAFTYRPGLARDGVVFDAARLIISTSKWAADSVRSEYPDCRTDIVVMPTPVDLPFFAADAWLEERHRRALAAGYRPRVLFVGGDFTRKGGYELLRAWRDGGFGRRASLELVTGAPIDPGLLSDGIVVHPAVEAYTPAWIDLWRSADIFILPTRQEAFATVFQEAAAAGLPAIGTRIMANPELIDDERSGLLIPRHDADSIAAALTRLLACADLRRRFGAEARAQVERRAHPERYRDRLAAIMRALAANPSGAARVLHGFTNN